jgi:hypothetical protein
MPTHSPADEAAIREQAYLFWEQDGRPDGRETEFWMRAVVAVTEKGQLDTLVKPAPKKPAAKVVAKGPAPKLKAAASSAKAAPAKTGKAAPKAAVKAKPKKK